MTLGSAGGLVDIVLIPQMDSSRIVIGKGLLTLVTRKSIGIEQHQVPRTGIGPAFGMAVIRSSSAKAGSTLSAEIGRLLLLNRHEARAAHRASQQTGIRLIHSQRSAGLRAAIDRQLRRELRRWWSTHVL